MIFAAGFGTRMAPLTDHRPKPLIDVAGRPLLDHALAQLAGAAPIVVNTHYLGDQIAAHLAGGPIVTLHEPTILDTGGGLRNALPLLRSSPGPVLTMNSDAVWTGTPAIEQLLVSWQPDEMDALLLCVARDKALGHAGKGDFLIGPDGRLSAGPGAIYTGAQIIGSHLLDGIEDDVFSMRVLWERAIAARRAFGVLHTGGWCDVGHPGGIALAEAMLGADHV